MKVSLLFLGLFLFQFGRFILFAWTGDALTRRKSDEWKSKHKIQKNHAHADQIKNELLRSAGTVAIIAAISTFGLSNPSMIEIYKNPYDYPLWWLPLSLVVLILVQDTYFYWVHRLLHHPKIFNHAHHVHHYSTNPTPYTSNSFHPFELIIEFVWLPVFLSFVPVHAVIVFVFSLIIMAMNVIGHLGYEIYPSHWKTHPVMKWLNSSTYHNNHHQHFNGNYSLYFRYWDFWMGTELKTSRLRDTHHIPSEECRTPLVG